MANSYHDNNNVSTLIAIGTDGSTIRNVIVDPTTNALGVSDGTTGSAITRTVSIHDGNHKQILMGVSSADLKTPIPICCDTSGNLLIKST